MKSFLESSGIPFDGNFIKLPEWTTRINLDIGSSYYAPHSQVWLESNPSLLVFAFDPVKDSINELKNGASLRFSNLPKAVEPKNLHRVIGVPCALGLESNVERKFYVTTDHVDCSSLLKPTEFSHYESTATVWKLDDFFDCLDFPIIDYVKIDTQGTDLDVVKGGVVGIKNRVVFITLETNSDQQYHNPTNIDVDEYMKSIGFERVYGLHTVDPTYINLSLQDKAYGCTVYQRT